MREYSFHASESTIDALAQLRRPWKGYAVTDGSVTVQLASGAAVLIAVEREELEPRFEVCRLTASVVPSLPSVAAPATDFGVGSNDIVVFQGETWLAQPEGPFPTTLGEHPLLKYTGKAGARAPHAEVVCTTTDAIVVAAKQGAALLAKLGPEPFTIEVVEDSAEIARFLFERGFEK